MINYKLVKLVAVLLLSGVTNAWSRQELNRLDNGQTVPAANWPSLVIVSSPPLADKCSGALIGPNVILTAAHCVGNKGRVAVNGVSAQCEIPSGPRRCPKGLDLALCLSDQPFAGIPRFERPAINLKWSAMGTEVTLSGFGFPLVGDLRIGKARVRTPAASTGCLEVGGIANGCRGDSGGAVFVNDRGRDVLAGVISIGGVIHGRAPAATRRGANSRSVALLNAPPSPGCAGGNTGIIDLASPAASKFIRDWRRRHATARICGLDPFPRGACF
jgi:hypothetical protein